MSENKCPLCGKETIDDEVFCRECQEIADSSLSDQLLAHESVDETIIDDNTPERHEEVIPEEDTKFDENELDKEEIVDKIEKEIVLKSRFPLSRNIIIISVFFLISLAGAGAYFYWQKLETDRVEAALWDKCIEENSPIAYSKYLQQYPNGEFQQQAHQKIVELRTDETKEWMELKKTNDINAYSAFLVDHPDSPHAHAVKTAMDSLSWISALADNTAASYKVYLSNADLGMYPGEYRALAQEKYDYLSQLRILEAPELEEIYKRLDSFFKELASNHFDKAKDMLSPTLINFFGVENKPRETIAKSIETDIKTRKIKSITYSIPAKQLGEVIQDNKGIYFFDLELTREIVYKDRKKKKEQTQLFVKMELNKDKLIQYISEKAKESEKSK